jgi:hypothetical protein
MAARLNAILVRVLIGYKFIRIIIESKICYIYEAVLLII